MVCFSFDGIKNITCGEGGCLVAFDAEAGRLASTPACSLWKMTRKSVLPGPAPGTDVKRQGWRYHMSNIMAAIGRVQLSRLDAEFIPARRATAARYAELSGVSGVAYCAPTPAILWCAISCRYACLTAARMR